MEWAQGGDVHSFIKPRTGRMRLFEKAGIEAIRFILGCTILSLEDLHGRGYTYCDLKPENILVFKDGYVKLGDFGLSVMLKEGEIRRSKTGTPCYFSPEMVARKRWGR
jgi:NIMA (never in mitosis gene a)-related kinase 1/4/5